MNTNLKNDNFKTYIEKEKRLKFIKEKITFTNFIYYYEKYLINLMKFCQVTGDFLKRILIILPNLNSAIKLISNIDITAYLLIITRVAISLVFYSKILLLISNIVIIERKLFITYN